MGDYLLGSRPVHLHWEFECAATVFALRADSDFPATILDNPLTDGQAETNTFHIHIFRSLRLSKLFEKELHLPIIYALSCVYDMHDQFFLLLVIRR